MLLLYKQIHIYPNNYIGLRPKITKLVWLACISWDCTDILPQVSLYQQKQFIWIYPMSSAPSSFDISTEACSAASVRSSFLLSLCKSPVYFLILKNPGSVFHFQLVNQYLEFIDFVLQSSGLFLICSSASFYQ